MASLPILSQPFFIHPVVPSSLVLSSQRPLPRDWPSFLCRPHSYLPGFLLAHLQLPLSGKGPLCAHLSPLLSLPPPTSAFGYFQSFLSHRACAGVACSPTPSQTLYSPASSVPTPAPWSITFPKAQQLCLLLAYPTVLVLDHRGHVICDNK